MGMTTDLSDVDVVMGRGEKKLFHAIKQAVDRYQPAAVFVYTTCVPALHGDDVDAVAKEAPSAGACQSYRLIVRDSMAARVWATVSAATRMSRM